jgi:hypothetical protein
VPIDQWIRKIRVRTLSFPLDGDLTEGGEEFLQQLFETR